MWCVCVLSMRQLREKVMKLKEDYDRIYHLSRTEGKPSINWGNMMDEKLVGNVLQFVINPNTEPDRKTEFYL